MAPLTLSVAPGLRQLRTLKLSLDSDAEFIPNNTLHILATQLHTLSLAELQISKEVSPTLFVQSFRPGTTSCISCLRHITPHDSKERGAQAFKASKEYFAYVLKAVGLSVKAMSIASPKMTTMDGSLRFDCIWQSLSMKKLSQSGA